MNGVQSFINSKKIISDSSKKLRSIKNSLNNNMVKIYKEQHSLIQIVKEFRDSSSRMRKGDYKKILTLNKIWSNNNDNNIMKNKKIHLISIKKRLTLSSRIVIK